MDTIRLTCYDTINYIKHAETAGLALGGKMSDFRVWSDIINWNGMTKVGYYSDALRFIMVCSHDEKGDDGNTVRRVPVVVILDKTK